MNFPKNQFALKYFFVCLSMLGASFGALGATTSGKSVKKLVFEEQKIEGKIRRPQLVLIKADQRPEFAPMVIQSLGKGGNIVDFVDPSVLQKSSYDGAFQFSGRAISNYQP